jgi:hypothetical protein
MQKLFTTQFDREVSSLVQKHDECGLTLTNYLNSYSKFLSRDANIHLWLQYLLKIIEIGDRLVTIMQKLFTTQNTVSVVFFRGAHTESGEQSKMIIICDRVPKVYKYCTLLCCTSDSRQVETKSINPLAAPTRDNVSSCIQCGNTIV